MLSSETGALPPRPKIFEDLVNNLISSLRGAFFMKVTPERFSSTWAQLVLLIFLSLIPVLLHNLVTYGAKGRLVTYALPGVLFFVPLVLITSWAISYRVRQPERVLLLMTAFIGIALQIDFIVTTCQITAEYWRIPRLGRRWSQFFYYAPYGWLALATGVAAIRLLELRRSLRLFALLMTAVLLGWPLAVIWHDRTLWMPPYEEDVEDHVQSNALLSEKVFYLQPQILERALVGIQPQRKGIPDLYFVGVAGYAAQDVFMNEVLSIKKLFEQRFDARGHSLLLINNPKTVADNPIASATSIRTALKLIGGLMDRENDVLFLYLSSHGSQESGFSLDFWPLQFDSLDPKSLRKILDESGIRNRVIVVSACYSGIYVGPLKNENTLIITAAAADRNSFGCQNKADFTYFGKAYFDEALRKTYSFTEAFELAKPQIAKREKQEGYEHSNPQIFVGKNIKRVLKNVEGYLELSN
jgi:hypothetical protein